MKTHANNLCNYYHHKSDIQFHLLNSTNFSGATLASSWSISSGTDISTVHRKNTQSWQYYIPIMTCWIQETYLDIPYSLRNSLTSNLQIKDIHIPVIVGIWNFTKFAALAHLGERQTEDFINWNLEVLCSSHRSCILFFSYYFFLFVSTINLYCQEPIHSS